MSRPAEEQVADLDPAAWEIVMAAAIDRAAADPDGQPVTVTDSVLRARRRRRGDSAAPLGDRAG